MDKVFIFYADTLERLVYFKIAFIVSKARQDKCPRTGEQDPLQTPTMRSGQWDTEWAEKRFRCDSVSCGKEWGREGDVVTWSPHPGGTCFLIASQPLPVSLLIKVSEPQRTASPLEPQNPSWWAFVGWVGWSQWDVIDGAARAQNGWKAASMNWTQQQFRTNGCEPEIAKQIPSFQFFSCLETNCENNFHKLLTGFTDTVLQF